MKDNAQILKEILAANGISKSKGALDGKSIACDFVRRVIQEGDVNQAIHYDDGSNGPRMMRPVEIVNYSAYHDCLGELVKAGALLDFDPDGYGNMFGDGLHKRAEKDGNKALLQALNGEIGIDLSTVSTNAVVRETNLEKDLREALRRQDTKAAIAAMDAGANPHIKIEGKSTLHRAVSMSTDLVDKILECGVSINAPDANNYTPLHEAARSCDIPHSARMVEYLLDKGADPYAGAWAWKNTPLHSVISNERPESAIALISIYIKRNLNFEKPDKDGKTVLHLACMVGLDDVVNHLIQAGANVHAVDDAGRTPLHYAALRGKENIARTLLKANAKLDAQDNQNNTPLHLCYSGEQSLRELFQMLEINPDRGASSVGNRQGRKPGEDSAVNAGMNGRRKIAQALVAVGAKQDVANHNGETPRDLLDNAFPVRQLIKQGGTGPSGLPPRP